MNRSSVAFLGLAFIIYWMFTSELPITKSTATFETLSPTNQVRTSSQTVDRTSPKSRFPSGESLRFWIQQEAQAIGQLDPNPIQTLKKLKARAAKLRRHEIEYLTQLALDKKANGDERFLCVYMLGLAKGRDALKSLKEIASSPISRTANNRSYSDEIVVRFHAMEAATKKLSHREAINFLRDILRQTADPSLAKHAQYWLARFG